MIGYMVIASLCLSSGTAIAGIIAKESPSKITGDTFRTLMSCLLLTFLTWLYFGE